MAKPLKVALLGSPNCGKSSLFNCLTGLNQKVGNFAGVTTERHSGYFRYQGQPYELVDLPGCYSLYARSEDEKVVLRTLLAKENVAAVLVVLNANHLERSLLLLTQVQDLELPVLAALNMVDEAFRAGHTLDVQALSERLQVPIVATNARTGPTYPQKRQPYFRYSNNLDSKTPTGRICICSRVPP